MNTKQYPDNIRAFLEDTKQLSKEHQIKIVLGKGKYIRYSGTKIGGYFDEQNKVLAVATNHPIEKWLDTMVHETCHLDQWIEQSKYWLPEINDAITIFEEYISGCPVTDIVAATNMIVMLEADCERRTIKKMLKYELPINTETYAKKANAYLLSHKAMIHYGSWYKKSPYRHGCIWGRLPNKISAPYKYKIQNNTIKPEFFKSCF